MHDYRDECVCCGSVTGLIAGLFAACAMTCLLSALHRIATAMMLGARVQVLDDLGDQLSAEEREQVLAKVKSRSVRW